MTAFILSWLGISVDYLISAALFVGGGAAVYFGITIPLLGGILRWIGYLLMLAGIVFGAFSYGKSVGAVDCYSAWHQADIAAQTARQNQEANASDIAEKTATELANKLAQQNNDYQKQISQYQSTIAPTATCRLPTVDDDRRMCDIIGNNSPGCTNSK